MCSIEMGSLKFTGQCGGITVSSATGGRRLPLKQRGKSSVGPTAGSGSAVGCWLVKFSNSAVPGFIGPFTVTQRQTEAKKESCSCCHEHFESRTLAARVCSPLLLLHVCSARPGAALATFIQLRPLKLQSSLSVFPLQDLPPGSVPLPSPSLQSTNQVVNQALKAQ